MKWRFLVLKSTFMVVALLILARLSYWQVVRAADLQSQAEGQRVTTQKISASRGEILGADGFPLASNKDNYLLYANPTLAKDITAEKLNDLAEALNSSESAKILSVLQQPNRLWMPVANNLSNGAKERIAALEIAGLGFETMSARFYPESSASGQLLGFVGQDQNGDPQGYFGLEGYYDNQLSGTAGRRVHEVDALNRPIVIGGENFVPPQEGRTIQTSIDRTLQHILFQKLTSGLSRYQAVSGTVSIMDPATGNLLAMVSLPGYDPASYGSFEPTLYKNPIVAESFEPGSTFKVLVMAAGLDAKVIKPDTQCDICRSSITVSDYPIRTWNNQYYPNSTMLDVIAHSDNVGMVFVSRKLGKNKLLNYIEKFGFGSSTGVDLQEESSPPLRPETEWREIDLATASFGQGIAVTPLQMVRAVGALANQGKMMTPRVVTAVDDRKVPIKSGVQVVSAGAAAQITQMMINSVEKGEAKWAKPAGFAIAGKTGTAQIPVAGHYDTDKTIASFVGFAPAYNPKFVMLVTLREPKSSPWGSETAAPLWFEIAGEVLRYYQVPPTH